MVHDAQFDITESEKQMPILRVRGEIDVASAPAFHASLSDLLDRDADACVVDLSDVSFIDSIGLGALVGAETRARGSAKSLRLVVSQPQIIKLLELTGLDKVFTVVPTTREAVTT
jgi:anti-sigma B factor antagonist